MKKSNCNNNVNLFKSLYRDMWALLIAIISFDDGRGDKPRPRWLQLLDICCSISMIIGFHVVMFLVPVAVLVWILMQLSDLFVTLAVFAFLIWFVVSDHLQDRRAVEAQRAAAAASTTWDRLAAFIISPACSAVFGIKIDVDMLRYSGEAVCGTGYYFDISFFTPSETDLIVLRKKIMRKLKEMGYQNVTVKVEPMFVFIAF